ncbi:MAG: YggT family protein [Lachnospirales bacterium]
MTLETIIIEGINIFAMILIYAILIRALLSWFVRSRNTFVDLLDSIINPIMNPIRKMVYNSPLGGPGMMIDISPIIAIVFIQFLAYIAALIVQFIL